MRKSCVKEKDENFSPFFLFVRGYAKSNRMRDEDRK